MNHKKQTNKKIPLHSWKQSQSWVSVFQGEGPVGEGPRCEEGASGSFLQSLGWGPKSI